MGVIKNGITAGFSGNVGNVIGSSWKGVAYMKSRPQKVKNPRSVGQVSQRTKMKNLVQLAQTFLSAWIQPLWNGAKAKMSGFNAFVMENIQAESDAGLIDNSKVIGATGPMASVPITAATYTAGTKTVAVTFPTTLDGELQSANDIAYVLVIDPTTNKGQGAHGALRSTGNISVVLPADIAANALTSLVFLAFKGNEPLIRPVSVSDSSSHAIVAA